MTRILLKVVAVLAGIGMIAVSPVLASGSGSGRSGGDDRGNEADRRVETKDDIEVEDGRLVRTVRTTERVSDANGVETRVETRVDTDLATGKIVRTESNEEVKGLGGADRKIEVRRDTPAVAAGVVAEGAKFEVKKEVSDTQGMESRVEVKVDKPNADELDELAKLEIRKESRDAMGVELQDVRIEKEVPRSDTGTLLEAAHSFLMTHFPGLAEMMHHMM